MENEIFVAEKTADLKLYQEITVSQLSDSQEEHHHTSQSIITCFCNVCRNVATKPWEPFKASVIDANFSCNVFCVSFLLGARNFYLNYDTHLY